MNLYRLDRTQELPITLEKAWSFFSNPGNLEAITPKELGFKILSPLEGKMHQGQIIHYKVKPMLNIPVTWVTEITHVEEGKLFIDEQRFGPYRFWHHQHWFSETEKGILTRDIVHYALPMGILGTIAHGIFVKRQLNTIFDHRYEVLEEYFKNN